MSKVPLLSIIVPVYNVEPFLKRCLDSICSQTYRNIEVICVNDGSTDNSLDILKEIEKEDDRIKVISQKNAGVSTARNVGIDQAKGEFITFVDSDDAVTDNMYSTLMEIFNIEDVDIVHCGYCRIDPNGNKKDVTGTGEVVIQSTLEAVECLVTGKLFVGSLCNKIYRRELFQNIRLDQNLKINEDILVNVQLFLEARSSYFKDLPLYVLYARDNSATSGTKSRIIAEDSVKASKKICELLKDTDLREEAAERLYRSLISQYQAVVFSKEKGDNIRIKQLQEEIEQVYIQCGEVPKKQAYKYKLLKYTPILYKTIYKLYDRIRQPNWDVAE